MKTLQTRSKTSPQGVLSIVLPTGLVNAEVDVVLIVSETTPNATPAGNGHGTMPDRAGTPESAGWNKFVDEIAGAWNGELIRPPQGEFEKREPFA